MNIKRLTTVILLAALLITLVGAVAGSALPIAIDKVEIDDTALSTGSTNRLDIERDQEVEVKVEFSSPYDLDDVELEAFFSGFEYNDVEPLGAQTTVFDMDANVTYVKRLRLAISGDVEEDDYKLRVLFTDRNGQPLITSYPIKLDVPRHRLDIQDVIFYPNNAVPAGNALLTTVRLENNGEKDQNDVRVQVSIPELGVSAVDYIDQIDSGDEEESEEIFMRIPQDAKSGKYEAIVDVLYDEGHRRVVRSYGVDVEGDPRYDAPTQSEQKAATLVTLGSTLETATRGDAPAVYPITVVNNGKNSRTNTLKVGSVDWADVSITPSSTMIIEGGDSKLYTVSVAPHSDAEAGAHVLGVELVEGGKTLKELQLTTNVKKGNTSLSTAKSVLQVLLVVLLVLLVIIGLVIGLRRVGGDEESHAQPETYY